MSEPAAPSTAFLRALRLLFATYLVLLALTIVLGVFWGLPVRWWIVDVPAGCIIAASLASACGIGLSLPWGERVARRTAQFALVSGLALLCALASSISALRAVYGPLGQGGLLVLALVALLALPYLVVMPALLLLWLGPAVRARRAPLGSTRGSTLAAPPDSP
jgi:hypothetical protein